MHAGGVLIKTVVFASRFQSHDPQLLWFYRKQNRRLSRALLSHSFISNIQPLPALPPAPASHHTTHLFISMAMFSAAAPVLFPPRHWRMNSRPSWTVNSTS